MVDFHKNALKLLL